MKITIDTDERKLIIAGESGLKVMDLYSEEAFEVVSHEWLKVGWSLKYSYTYTWLGRPIIQLPEDMFRIQELIFRLKPDVIIETGIAHGGSLVYYAGLCELLGSGRVVGIDIEIRPHNRRAIEGHELFGRITMIEGDSSSEEILAEVARHVDPGEKVLVILDSCHTKEHVRAELEAYHGFVNVGSYIVATDGIMRDLTDVPNGNSEWNTDNPAAAAEEFVLKHPEFEIQRPPWMFNESLLSRDITYWPGAYLLRTA